MTTQIPQKAKLTQKLGSYNYQLIIPIEVERKIRFACQRVWNTEWSGVLFFNYEGSFENDDLKIICKDIYIMDIGSQTYTEFDMNPDVISYMTDNIELLECQLGLIHSHNNMSTFFSGTDQATLLDEGIDRNNFVSLIVNNAGNYTAAITRKVTSKEVHETSVYEFFGEGEKEDSKNYVIDKDEIEWFYLKVVKENDEFSFPDMDSRFEEIKKSKEVKARMVTTNNFSMQKNLPSANNQPTIPNKVEVQKELPFEEVIDLSKYKFNKDTIKTLLLQCITGSVVLSSESRLDPVKWCGTMVKMYENRFGKGDEGMRFFSLWADTYTEFLTWYAEDDKLYEKGLTEDEVQAVCAYNLIEELEKLPQNIYIKGYIEALQKYTII